MIYFIYIFLIKEDGYMTAEAFKQQLIIKLADRLSRTLINFADESIDYGMDTYIQNGYITIDFKDVLVVIDPHNIDIAPDKMHKLRKMGLNWYDTRKMRDKAWRRFVRHLKKGGWKGSFARINDKWQYIVFLP